MREIKFRAWNNSGGFFTEDHVKHHLFGFLSKGDYPVMQYTGLKDKNGKEIYEYDAVTYFYAGCTRKSAFVRFEDGAFRVNGMPIGYLVENWNLEVIGNAYENPELLT